MSKNPYIIEQLHFVRFRNTGFKRTAVLSPKSEKLFTRFLVNAFGYNVFVISTALGLDVYYSSSKSKTDFIEKNLWLFQESEDIQRTLLVEEYHNNDVLFYFNSIVTKLIDHPQLFLSTCKKFMHHYNTYSVKSRLLVLLYSVFEAHLQRLITDDKLPYTDKIKKLLTEDYVPTSESLKIINNLTQTYLKDKSYN